MSDSSSTADSSTDATQRQGRQVAKRAFAAELNDATHVFKESDEERAPNLALLPSGEPANRYFLVGTVTEVNDVGRDSEYWQARVVDPTGTMFAYAGQYQPDATAFLSDVEPPAYIALTAKPSTYETDDGGVNVSLRPETITCVDEATRNQWVRETIDQTAARLDTFEEDNGSNPYIAMSREQYGEDLSLDTYRAALNDAREDVGLESVPIPDSDSDSDPIPGADDAGMDAEAGDDIDDPDQSEPEGDVDEAAIATAVANAGLEE